MAIRTGNSPAMVAGSHQSTRRALSRLENPISSPMALQIRSPFRVRHRMTSTSPFDNDKHAVSTTLDPSRLSASACPSPIGVPNWLLQPTQVFARRGSRARRAMMVVVDGWNAPFDCVAQRVVGLGEAVVDMRGSFVVTRIEGLSFVTGCERSARLPTQDRFAQ